MRKTEYIFQALVTFLQWLCLGLVIGLTLVVFFKVFFRYVLNNPIVWSDEVIMFLMLCLTYFGAALAAHRGGHINVELLETILGAKHRRILKIWRSFSDIIIMVVLVIVMIFGIKLSIYSRDQQTDILLLSYFWIYIVLPIALLFMIIMTGKKILNEWKK
ncbi:MAG: TRAP transporter small permease [Deltaproteobacteria bacterium]|nr:TRAP transporter small permease [Deltaproteobacteria bacterium]